MTSAGFICMFASSLILGISQGDARTLQITDTPATVDLANRSRPLILDSSTRNAIVREGDPGTLACFASGYPEPRVYWSRKQELSPHKSKVTGNIIRISNVTRLDKGKYYCEAVNRLGRTSHTVNLDVVYPPEMLSTSTHASYPEGATVELACKADGSPVPQVYWSRGEGFSAEQAAATGEILRLTNITRKDSGSYYCLAINSLGVAKLTSKVDVMLPSLKLDTTTPSILAPVPTDVPKVEFVKFRVAVKKVLPSVPLGAIQSEKPEYPVEFLTWLAKYSSRLQEKQGVGNPGTVTKGEEKLVRKAIT